MFTISNAKTAAVTLTPTSQNYHPPPARCRALPDLDFRASSVTPFRRVEAGHRRRGRIRAADEPRGIATVAPGATPMAGRTSGNGARYDQQ